MVIHCGFEPDAERARNIDRRTSPSSHQGRSFRRLKSPGSCPVSALYLEKFLDGSQCSVLPPSSETADQFAGRFERGLNLLKKAAPELAGEVEAIVHEVIPIIGVPGKKMQIDGGSHYQLWGALFLNAGFHPTDEAMAEVIAHESAHSLLFGLCTHQTLVLNDDADGYPSPLREDLRPMDGIYHATFVSARMYWAMNRLLEAVATMRKSQKDVEQKEEELLQASADVAESQGALTEQIIEVVHIIHSKWDELDYAQREQFGEVIEDYMDSREDYLASLPIEDRLRLEKLYPKWW